MKVRTTQAEGSVSETIGPDAGANPAARGSLALLLAFVVIAALNYVYAVVMSWLLPVEGYGALGVAQAVLLISSTIVAAGFPWALARTMARTRSMELQARAVRATMVGTGALGAVLSLGLLLVAQMGAVQPAALYGPILVIAGATIAVLTVNAVLVGALQGRFLLRELALARAVEVIVKLVAGVGLVLAGAGVVGSVQGFLVGAVVATALAAWWLRGFPLLAGRGWRDGDVFGAAGPMFLAMVGFSLISQLDIVTLKIFAVGDADFQAGQYQVAVTLGRVPYFAGLAVFAAVFPFVSSASDDEAARVYASLALRYTLLFIVPIGVVLAVSSDSMIRLFFSARYDGAAGPLTFVAMGAAALTITFALATLLQARGQVRRPATVLVLGVASQVILAAILVPPFGASGAAVAMLLPATAALLGLAAPVLRTFRLRPTARGVIGWLAANAMLALLFGIAPSDGRLGTLLTLILGAVAYCIAVGLLRLVDSDDVRTLGGALGSRGEGLTRRVGSFVDRLQGRGPHA